MEFNEFYDRFKPIRNTLEHCSPLMNCMFEREDEEQMEIVESKNLPYIWSYNHYKQLVNGLHYKHNYIGYVICKIPCDFHPGEIIVKT